MRYRHIVSADWSSDACHCHEPVWDTNTCSRWKPAFVYQLSSACFIWWLSVSCKWLQMRHFKRQGGKTTSFTLLTEAAVDRRLLYAVLLKADFLNGLWCREWTAHSKSMVCSYIAVFNSRRPFKSFYVPVPFSHLFTDLFFIHIHTTASDNSAQNVWWSTKNIQFTNDFSKWLWLIQ